MSGIERARGDHHLALRVSDIERSGNFYVEALGARWLTRPIELEGREAEIVMQSPPGTRMKYAFIGFATGIFELIEFVEPRVPTAATSSWEDGILHYCFTVSDVPAALERIVAHGGRQLEDIHTVGEPSISVAFAADPDGNTIQLLDIDMDEVVERVVADGHGPVPQDGSKR